jgi:polar amino acid transport system substrate-binding protein
MAGKGTEIGKSFEEIKAIIDKYAKGEGIVAIESAVKDLDRASEQLVVATNAAFAPFEYKDGNKFAGIDIEIMKLVADTLGLELVIEDMEFDSVVTSVGKNGIDVAAAGLSVNETRKQSVNFSETYYNAAQVLIVMEDCTDFDDCKTAEEVLAKFEELR